jgi:hypothetical protein
MKRIIATLKLNFAPSTTGPGPLLWSSPAVQVSAAEGLARLIAALGPEYVQGSGEILTNTGFAIVRLTVTDRGVEIVRNFWDVKSVQSDTLASTFVQPDMTNAPVYSTSPVQTAIPVPTVGVSLPGAGAALGVPPTMATTDAGEVPNWLLWGGLIAIGFYLMKGTR